MNRHLACPMLRAAAQIVRHHKDDTVPADCRECPWWDKQFGECWVRLITMAPAGELLINGLNNNGLADVQIAKLLGVNKSCVSRWHSGLERIPEKRAQQLYQLSERLKAGDEGLDKIAVENRAWMRAEQTREVRILLNRLNRYGRSNANIAQYFDISRGAVSRWKSGRSLPSTKRLKELEELAEEEAVRHKRRFHT